MPRDMLEDIKIASEQKPVEFGDIATLHELLAFALSDFQKVLDDPRYDVDMSLWHKPSSSKARFKSDPQVCRVCLAGSVIAKSLGALPDQDLTIDDFNEREDRRLEALDNLRCGDINEAYRLLYAEVDVPVACDKLDDKWLELLEGRACSEAANKVAGASLMRELRRMHADLKQAGI